MILIEEYVLWFCLVLVKHRQRWIQRELGIRTSTLRVEEGKGRLRFEEAKNNNYTVCRDQKPAGAIEK